MANKLQESEIVEKDLYQIGSKFAKSLEVGLDKLKEFTLQFDKLSKAYKVSPNQTDFIAKRKQEVQLTEQTSIALKEQKRAELNLIKTLEKRNIASESTNKALIKQRLELQRLNAIEKENAVLTSKTSSEMQKAEVRRKKLIRTIQDLQLKQKLGKKLSDTEQRELRQSTREFLKYDKAIRVAKNTTGQFQENVGNYPKFLGGAISSFRTLIPLIGAGFGLREAWNFTKESLQLVRESKGVEFAFNRIGLRGTDAFNKIKISTRGLLSDLDIKKTLVEFDNFNLSLEDSDTLLEFVALRSAQTGKSIEYMTDSLVEGLSKESLRRLDNLGISMVQMREEMDKFGLSVNEAFTKLARQEIQKSGDVIGAAANSQERFNAALENFRISSGSGFIKSLTDDFYELGTAILSSLSDVNDASDGFVQYVGNLFRIAQGQAMMVKSDAIIKKNQRQINKLRKEAARIIKQEGEELQLSNDKILMNVLALNKLNQEELRAIIQKKRKSEITDKEILDVATLKEKITDLKSQQEGLTIEDKKQSTEINKKIKYYQNLIDSILGVVRGNKKLKASDFELAQFRVQQQIKAQQEIIDSEDSKFNERLRALQVRENLEIQLAENKEAHLLSNQKLNANERTLIEEQTSAKLVDIYKKTNEEIDKLKVSFLESVPDIVDEDFEDDIDILKQGIKSYAEVLGIDGEGAVQSFMEKHGADFTKIKGFYDELDNVAEKSNKLRKELVEDLSISGIDFVNSLFDNTIQKYDDELTALDDYYTLRQEAAEGDRHLQQFLRLEEQEEEKKIQKKKRDEQRKQAIFNKLFSVAQIGIKLQETLAAINLAAATIDAVTLGTGGAAYKIANIPFAIGSAALQTATVLATPIPKYAKGTDNHQGGLALTGEERPEVILEPNKDPYIVSKPTILDLPKRTQVIPSIEEYQRLFNKTQIASLQINGQNAASFQQSKQIFDDTNMREDLKELIRATKRNKPYKSVQNKTTDFNHELFRAKNTNWEA